MINVNKESVKLEGSAVTLLSEWSLLTDKLYTLISDEIEVSTEELLRANVEIVISVINLKKDNSND
jgi:hypothetical protein